MQTARKNAAVTPHYLTAYLLTPAPGLGVTVSGVVLAGGVGVGVPSSMDEPDVPGDVEPEPALPDGILLPDVPEPGVPELGELRVLDPDIPEEDPDPLDPVPVALGASEEWRSHPASANPNKAVISAIFDVPKNAFIGIPFTEKWKLADCSICQKSYCSRMQIVCQRIAAQSVLELCAIA